MIKITDFFKLIKQLHGTYLKHPNVLFAKNILMSKYTTKEEYFHKTKVSLKLKTSNY